MRNIPAFIVIAVAFASLPTSAHDLAAQKQAMLADTRQETVALGGNRFLIFSGSKAAYQYVYSIDLVEITGGAPHYDPLFIQEYNPATGKISLSSGVAFEATSYHFDTVSKTLNYTSIDAGNGPRLAYSYQLSGDTLVLEQVLAQAQTKDNPPITVFDAHAKKN
ncbi:MAG: hypothetical protein KGJ21_03720 [Pseudomonadota bacterium]|nr:hypothetical protein [Pseudomonadota bacterium]